MKEWHTSFLSLIPGHLGQFLRRQYFRKRLKKCETGLIIATNVKIRNPQNLEVGIDVVITENAFINAGGSVTIGDNTIIGPYVKIWSINHRYESLTIPIWKQGWEKHPVKIGQGVWIGAGAIILPGVTIGEGAVIGAGAVIPKDIPAYSIAVGNPGRVVGSRCTERVKEDAKPD